MERGDRLNTSVVSLPGRVGGMSAPLTARADVPTDAPARYAKQLVSHLGHRLTSPPTATPRRRRSARPPARPRRRRRPHAARRGAGRRVAGPGPARAGQPPRAVRAAQRAHRHLGDRARGGLTPTAGRPVAPAPRAPRAPRRTRISPDSGAEARDGGAQHPPPDPRKQTAPCADSWAGPPEPRPLCRACSATRTSSTSPSCRPSTATAGASPARRRTASRCTSARTPPATAGRSRSGPAPTPPTSAWRTCAGRPWG